MLLRRIYQGIGLFFLAFAAFCAVSGIVRVGNGGITSVILGLMLGAFFFTIGFAIFKFATGPAEIGQETLGIEEKARIERERSLKRKPQTSKSQPSKS